MDKLRELRLKCAVCSEIIYKLAEKDFGRAKPRRRTAINDITYILEDYNKQAMEERLRLEQLPRKSFWNKLFG